jgi:hypothetical protein
MNRILCIILPIFVLGGLVVWRMRSPTKYDVSAMNSQSNFGRPMDLSSYSETPPAKPLDLLFIHHSCGGQLLAVPGPESETNCIYASSVNGGGLRSRLEKAGYIVHEASYESRIGHKTDIFDWLPKFRDQMNDVLECDLQDQRLAAGRRNNVVIFKSCFPNNSFVAEGTAPGDPAGPDLTLWNAKAAYAALLPEFRKQPGVLFVCVTAPPLVQYPQPAWKQILKKMLGRQDGAVRSAWLAREFNNWLSGSEGWLKNYGGTNVVVFDYYDLLTDGKKSNFARFPSNPLDSHPGRDGNERAAQALVPLVNRAVRRTGLVP